MMRSSLAPADSATAMEPTFDQRVYAMVARIPAGQLATYGQIAELIGAWGCARQVGWALRRLPPAERAALASCSECQGVHQCQPGP